MGPWAPHGPMRSGESNHVVLTTPVPVTETGEDMERLPQAGAGAILVVSSVKSASGWYPRGRGWYPRPVPNILISRFVHRDRTVAWR